MPLLKLNQMRDFYQSYLQPKFQFEIQATTIRDLGFPIYHLNFVYLLNSVYDIPLFPCCAQFVLLLKCRVVWPLKELRHGLTRKSLQAPGNSSSLYVSSLSMRVSPNPHPCQKSYRVLFICINRTCKCSVVFLSAQLVVSGYSFYLSNWVYILLKTPP